MEAFIKVRTIAPIMSRFITKLRTLAGQKFHITKDGIKYSNVGYNSDQFSTYVTNEANLQQLDVSFSDLILPPDALKNQYTWAGKSIDESPHYRLIHELATGVLTQSSEYVQLCLAGRLDARRPFRPKLRKLQKIFDERMGELSRNRPFDIFVYQPARTEKIIIADGKHRAALAAYMGKPDIVRLNFISQEVFLNPFFVGFYGQVLNAASFEYSINQHLIRLMMEPSEETTAFA